MKGLNKGRVFLFCIRMLMVVLPVVLVFGLIWLRSNTVAVEYELGQLNRQLMKLQSEKVRLLARRAELTSLKKLERVAQKRFGLTYTNRTRVFFVRETPPPTPYNTGLGEIR